MDTKSQNNITHLVILLVLVVALLAVLIFTGLIGCNIVPGGCDIYYSVLKGGKPDVLIVYGDSGLGDHTKLEQALTDRGALNINVRSMPVEKISYGNIKEYNLVIVEQAKKICSKELKIFEYYINNGGKLVWTGDAGTELCDGDELLKESERTKGGADSYIGPWARRDGDRQLSFDELLGLDYKGNLCELTSCSEGEEKGRIEVIETSQKLVKGLSPSIPFKSEFAVTQLKNAVDVRLIAVLDYGTNLLGQSSAPWMPASKQDFGKKLPFIVSSGAGERVAYYAAPIESFIDDSEHPYRALIEQMYYGMLYS
ncbi:MAG: hypothetical protein AABW99_02155 [archaeon]